MLALGPLVALCAALTGGVALYRIANRSGFNAREVVGTAGVDYILASGSVLLGPLLLVGGCVAILLWTIARRVSTGAMGQLPTWLSIVLIVVTVGRCLDLWFGARQPPYSRIVLDTKASFCGRILLVTGDRLYVRVRTRAAQRTDVILAATSIPSARVIAVASPPATGCSGAVSIDLLAGRLGT